MVKSQIKTAESAAQTDSRLPMDYDVRIFGVKSSGAQRASASVNINGAFAIRGVKVLQSSKGLFVAMPQYKVGSEYKDICFPCTKESREQFNAAVIKAYEQTLNQKQSQAQSDEPAAQQTQTMGGM
jgi:stage V sporulation protein G